MSLILETRRRNLELTLSDVQQTLSDIPNLSLQLESIKKEIVNRVGKTREYEKLIGDCRWGNESTKELNTLADLIFELLGWVSGLSRQLKALEKSSFFVQISESGLSARWLNELRALAARLQESAVDANDWQRLATVETRARDDLFGKSLELLGGLALRDSRLNADLCELADDLLWAMGMVEPRHFAIMGGLNSKLMRLERVVRLPFPLWSVWDLPFAAHDFWHANSAAAKNVRDRAITELRECPVAKADVDAVLADVLATNSLGPAYGYAALTLWFAPSDPQFDPRVRAICAMLRAMNGKKSTGVVAAYHAVSDHFGEAWREAVQEARPEAAAKAAAQDDKSFERLLSAFVEQASQYDLNPEQGRAALLAARRRVAPTLEPEAASSPTDAQLETLCSALITGMKEEGYKQFRRQDWQNLTSWDNIQQATDGTIDLRHLLNAAWKERVKKDEIDDKALTKTLTEMAKVLRPPREKR